MIQIVWKWDSHVLSGPDLEISWYFVSLFLIFLVKTGVKREHLADGDFRHCFGNFSESAIPKVSSSKLS